MELRPRSWRLARAPRPPQGQRLALFPLPQWAPVRYGRMRRGAGRIVPFLRKGRVMATSAPAKGPSSPLDRIPPDESMWQRYSPHGEAPISAAASVALHALAFGGLLLFG